MDFSITNVYNKMPLIGDTFLVPNKYFFLMGGIKAWYLESVVFQIDGTIVFSNNIEEWPKDSEGKMEKVKSCIPLE